MVLLKEFKEFAMRGNVMDMAVGIIIGAAFGKIVNSFVNDILMPPLGKLMGGTDFSDLFINLGERGFSSLDAAREAGAPVIAYGMFVNVLIDFTIVAFAIFLMIKAINRLNRKEAAAPPPPAPATKDQILLEEIRDLLKNRAS